MRFKASLRQVFPQLQYLWLKILPPKNTPVRPVGLRVESPLGIKLKKFLIATVPDSKAKEQLKLYIPLPRY